MIRIYEDYAVHTWWEAVQAKGFDIQPLTAPKVGEQFLVFCIPSGCYASGSSVYIDRMRVGPMAREVAEVRRDLFEDTAGDRWRNANGIEAKRGARYVNQPRRVAIRLTPWVSEFFKKRHSIHRASAELEAACFASYRFNQGQDSMNAALAFDEASGGGKSVEVMNFVAGELRDLRSLVIERYGPNGEEFITKALNWKADGK